MLTDGLAAARRYDLGYDAADQLTGAVLRDTVRGNGVRRGSGSEQDFH